MKPTVWARVWMLVVMCLFGTGGAVAQTTGEIRGSVKDPSGAVVPSATIIATLAGTETTRGVLSDKDGDFDIPELAVGTYSLSVDAGGFKHYVAKDVVITIGHVAVLNVTLQVGGKAETITVEANAVQVETTSTQLGAVMNDTAVRELPLNTRDTYQLLQLQPGVQSQLGSNLFYGSDQPGVVSVNGGRGRSNNYMVNGGDANDEFVNLPAIQPSPDAIEEFRVITNTFDAEYGRNSGSVVNVVTKSGSNEFHGDVFEFFRNQVLNSRGFFDSVLPDSKQNQFGGTFGGPIRKEHTFFFGSYEGRRIRKGISSDQLLDPTAAERAGDFSASTPGGFIGTLTTPTVAAIVQDRCGGQLSAAANTELSNIIGGGMPTPNNYGVIFPNAHIPTQCFDPVAASLFNQFVAPSDPNGIGAIQTVPVERDRGDQFTIRVDHRINSAQQLSAYYYFNDLDQFQPFSNFQAAGANVPGFGDFNRTRVQQINVSHTWTLGSTAVNEARFAYFREAQPKLDHPQVTNLVTNSCTGAAAAFCFTGTTDTSLVDGSGNPIAPNAKLGITPNLGSGHEGVPFLQVAGGFFIGNNFEGELPQTGNSFQWTDTYSKVIGKHSLKFGGDVRHVNFNQMLFFEVNGFFTFSSGGPNSPGGGDLFPDYFLGLPTSYGQGSAQGENVRGNSVYLFAQDSWKIKPNLTLNYGLRWEFNAPIYDTQNRVQTFRPGQTDTVFPCVISALGASETGFSQGSPCGPGTPQESIFPLGLVVPGDQGVPRGLTQTYYKAFAPRIGLAWSPDATTGWLSKLTGGPGKTSVRAGYGIFYNPVEQLVLEQFSAEPPFGGSSALSNVLFQAPYVSQSGVTSPNAFNGVLSPTPGQPVDWSVFRPLLLFGEFQPHLRPQYAEQYNLTIQRELPAKMLFQIGYVGSQGHRLLATRDINHGNPQTCLDLAALGQGCGPFGEDSQYQFTLLNGQALTLPSGQVVTGAQGGTPIDLVGTRPFSSPFCNPVGGANCPPDGVPVFGSIYAQDTIGNSNYNSLQVLVEKQFAHGLQFQGAYTFSKSIDDASSFEELQNPFNSRLSRSLSLFNAAHRFVLSYYWELPVPKYGGFAGKIGNGWALSGIVTYQTGFPIRLGISSTTSLATTDTELLDGAGTDFTSAGEPNLISPFVTQDPHKGGCNPFAIPAVACRRFDPTLFVDTNPGTIGNAPRTICCASPISQSDLAILKATPINERFRTEFRVEFFNAFNHTQFFPPDGNFPDGSDFGRVKKARDPREIQFALKVLF